MCGGDTTATGSLTPGSSSPGVCGVPKQLVFSSTRGFDGSDAMKLGGPLLTRSPAGVLTHPLTFCSSEM